MWWYAPIISKLGRQREEDAWVLVASQSSCISKLCVQWEILYQKIRRKVTEKAPDFGLWPSHIHICANTHLNTRACAHTNLCLQFIINSLLDTIRLQAKATQNNFLGFLLWKTCDSSNCNSTVYKSHLLAPSVYDIVVRNRRKTTTGRKSLTNWMPNGMTIYLLLFNH